MSILQTRNLQKSFGGLAAVRGVDLDVRAGEILGLFGPNGAGKTTLFNMIAGTLHPNAGTVTLGRRDVTALPAWRRARLGIGRTFQVTRPFRDLTVLENVLAGVPRMRTGHGDAMDKARSLLAQVSLGNRANQQAGSLTLGMLKRLEVARVLAIEPKVLLLDEPLAGLTARESAEILELVATLKTHTAIVMVEHNVRQSLPVCDRAIVLDAGAVIASGTPDDIRSDPNVVKAYLGTAEIDP
jgi:LPS export ABC transporter ATP-binding protein